MDIEKLIEKANHLGMELKSDGGEFEYSIGKKFLEYATTLSTLQAENSRLRAELERTQQGQCAGCSVPVVNAESLRDLQDAPKLRAELEQVRRERDAAKSTLAERIGVRGAEPITTAFGLPIDRLRELAQADREGRCMVLPKDGMVYYIEEAGGEKWIGNKPIQQVILRCGFGMALLEFSLFDRGKYFSGAEAGSALRREPECRRN